MKCCNNQQDYSGSFLALYLLYLQGCSHIPQYSLYNSAPFAMLQLNILHILSKPSEPQSVLCLYVPFLNYNQQPYLHQLFQCAIRPHVILIEGLIHQFPKAP